MSIKILIRCFAYFYAFNKITLTQLGLTLKKFKNTKKQKKSSVLTVFLLVK